MLVSQVVTQRDAHLLNTREMSAAFREAYPRGPAAAAGRRRPPLRRDDGRRARRRPGLRPRHDARRGRVATSSTGSSPSRKAPRDGRAHERPRRRAHASSHRRYVPYSHAHYAGNLVDGAYSLGLFGDVATEVCIRTDGDEGLFASYSDVQFRAPVRAGDVLEVDRDGDPGRHPQPRARAARRGSSAAGAVVGRRVRPRRPSAAVVLDPPVVAVTAVGTVVVPPSRLAADGVLAGQWPVRSDLRPGASRPTRRNRCRSTEILCVRRHRSHLRLCASVQVSGGLTARRSAPPG